MRTIARFSSVLQIHGLELAPGRLPPSSGATPTTMFRKGDKYPHLGAVAYSQYDL